MNITTNNYDESTNHDLPGEHLDWVHDEISGIEIIDDPYGDEVWENSEDDSWSDSDSLTSCGWGEDESYGSFE